MSSKCFCPADPSFELVTVRVPTGAVPDPDALAAKLAAQAQETERAILLANLRSMPLADLKKAFPTVSTASAVPAVPTAVPK